MNNVIREMTVSDGPGDRRQRPMIRLVNQYLAKAGFQTGRKIEVQYKNGKIIITRLPFQNER